MIRNYMENILEVNNLSVKIDGEKIIEDISFNVKENETLVILGPNGAGKTVLLKSLLNLLPYTGKIDWKKGLAIGYVPQRLSLTKDFPLTVKEFFNLHKQSSLESIDQILSWVGIEDKTILEKRISSLSTGQFQRILVGWGLIGNVNVLLFDEPMAGIDIGGQETIYNLLAKLKKERGITIILISHDLNIVYDFADRVICLNKKMICFGAPREVLDSQQFSNIFGGEIKSYQHKH